MGWLTGIIAIVEAVPQVISLIEQVIAAINGHPQGQVAGVQAVMAHMSNFSNDSSVVGNAPALKND